MGPFLIAVLLVIIFRDYAIHVARKLRTEEPEKSPDSGAKSDSPDPVRILSWMWWREREKEGDKEENKTQKEGDKEKKESRTFFTPALFFKVIHLLWHVYLCYHFDFFIMVCLMILALVCAEFFLRFGYEVLLVVVFHVDRLFLGNSIQTGSRRVSLLAGEGIGKIAMHQPRPADAPAHPTEQSLGTEGDSANSWLTIFLLVSSFAVLVIFSFGFGALITNEFSHFIDQKKDIFSPSDTALAQLTEQGTLWFDTTVHSNFPNLDPKQIRERGSAVVADLIVFVSTRSDSNSSYLQQFWDLGSKIYHDDQLYPIIQELGKSASSLPQKLISAAVVSMDAIWEVVFFLVTLNYFVG